MQIFHFKWYVLFTNFEINLKIGVRCPHHGMDCCGDYDEDEYFYSDDEYYDYTDEESEDEFLDSIAQR